MIETLPGAQRQDPGVQAVGQAARRGLQDVRPRGRRRRSPSTARSACWPSSTTSTAGTRTPLWDDIKFSTTHCTKIERIALVGEKKWEEWMAKVCKPFTMAKIKYFDAANSTPPGPGSAKPKHDRAHRNWRRVRSPRIPLRKCEGSPKLVADIHFAR